MKLQPTPSAVEEARRITQAANWMHRIMLDRGPNKLIRRPDKRITREFLAVAPWPDLLALLRTMHHKAETPGTRYPWFVEQAQWRINGRTTGQVRDLHNAQRSIIRDQREREASA